MATQNDVEFYGLKPSEVQQVQEIRDQLSIDGGHMTIVTRKGKTVPAYWKVLKTKRFLVDRRGRVWRFRQQGAPSSSLKPSQSSPTVYRGVEMWTGKWRRCIGTDGTPTYAKKTMWVSLEGNTNVPLNNSPIEWHMANRDFKHPLDEPHSPTPFDLRVLDNAVQQAEHVVYAETVKAATKSGMDPQEAADYAQGVIDADPAIAAARKAAEKAPKTRRRRKTPKRTNKKRAASKNIIAEAEADEQLQETADAVG